MIKSIELTVEAVFCDVCGEDVHSYDGWSYYEDEGKHYCPDCAYKSKVISKKEWCEINGICLNDRALKSVEICDER